jgi:hypothetical protein
MEKKKEEKKENKQCTQLLFIRKQPFEQDAQNFICKGI